MIYAEIVTEKTQSPIVGGKEETKSGFVFYGNALDTKFWRERITQYCNEISKKEVLGKRHILNFFADQGWKWSGGYCFYRESGDPGK